MNLTLKNLLTSKSVEIDSLAVGAFFFMASKDDLYIKVSPTECYYLKGSLLLQFNPSAKATPCQDVEIAFK